MYEDCDAEGKFRAILIWAWYAAIQQLGCKGFRSLLRVR
jgi:hypothetical protein